MKEISEKLYLEFIKIKLKKDKVYFLPQKTFYKMKTYKQ